MSAKRTRTLVSPQYSGVDKRQLGRVMGELNKRIGAFGKANARGLLKGGLFLQRESQKIVPVDTSNLKAGAFTRSVGTDKAPAVAVGYDAAYAIFVHEDLQARHAPGKTAKYLQKPAFEQAQRIVQIVADETKGASK